MWSLFVKGSRVKSPAGHILNHRQNILALPHRRTSIANRRYCNEFKNRDKKYCYLIVGWVSMPTSNNYVYS